MRFFDAGESDVEAAERVSKARIVDAQNMEHRRVQVSEVDGRRYVDKSWRIV